MSTAKCLLTVLLFFGSLCQAATSVSDEEMRNQLMQQLVDFVSVSLEEWSPEQSDFGHSEKPYVHSLSPCYMMAWLYKNPHPLNPYFRREEIRDKAIRMCDQIAARETTIEWPFYSFCQVYDLLREELSEERKTVWRDYVNFYIRTRGSRPFFYTSFNHEAFNALGVLRAGQVFKKPEWEERGRRLMHQLIKVQTDLGYFNEGPGHGPSMKYNQVQLAGMLLFADYSGDEEVLEASRKLADFMIRYAFPDGSTAGSLEGRQSWSIGFYGTTCYGLDRWPLGKELNRRIFSTRKKWGLLDPRSPYYSLSDWYACFGGWWLMDEYLSLRPDAEAEPLPQDKNGYRMVESGPTFSGGMIRRNDWVVGMSGIQPVPGENIYRLERQSRIDIWHEKPGLIVGGGPNLVGAEIPMANVHLVTGYGGADCKFGRLTGGEARDRRAIYFPRSVEVSLKLDEQRLRESFGQGDVLFAVRPLESGRLQITFEYDVFATRKVCLQLPLIIFHDSEIQVDEVPFSGNQLETVQQSLLISNPTTQTKIRITVPPDLDAALRPPLHPIRWYAGEHDHQRYEPFYQISLLSVEIDSPNGRGTGDFWIEILDD